MYVSTHECQKSPLSRLRNSKITKIRGYWVHVVVFLKLGYQKVRSRDRLIRPRMANLPGEESRNVLYDDHGRLQSLRHLCYHYDEQIALILRAGIGILV